MAAIVKKKVYVFYTISATGVIQSHWTVSPDESYRPVHAACTYGVGEDGALYPGRKWKSMGHPHRTLRRGWMRADNYLLNYDIKQAIRDDPSLFINWSATDLLRSSMIPGTIGRFNGGGTPRYPRRVHCSRKQVFIVGPASLGCFSYKFWNGVRVNHSARTGLPDSAVQQAFGNDALLFSTAGELYCLFQPIPKGLGKDAFEAAQEKRGNQMLQARLMFG